MENLSLIAAVGENGELGYNNSLIWRIREANTEFMVVGGSKVYEQLLPYVQIMYLTEIKREAYADSFFPYFDKEEWNITEIGDFLDNNVPYVRNKYVRKRSKIRQWEN